MIRKTCQALDFAKSGVPPADLTPAPSKNGQGKEIPPERSSRKADFKRKEENGPTYASHRINGILHRSNRQLSSLITTKESETALKVPSRQAPYNPLQTSTVFDALYNIYSKKVPSAQLAEMQDKVQLELNKFLALEKVPLPSSEL